MDLWPLGEALRRTAQALSVLTLVTAAASAITPQKQPVILRNGEVVDLRGTLAVEHRGWNQFLLLRTQDPYALVPNAVVATLPVPHPVVREFGLTLSGQDDRLARLAGKQVRVSGRLQFTPESVALWNGTVVWATVVGIPGGAYLDPRSPEPGLSLAVHRYTATVTLWPDRWARTYTARDLETRKPLRSSNLAGCRPDAEGNVLNCSCSDGFRPYSAVVRTATGTLQPTMTAPFARFAVGPPARTPITAEVECGRVAPDTPAAPARASSPGTSGIAPAPATSDAAPISASPKDPSPHEHH